MKTLIVLDRLSHALQEEKIAGKWLLTVLYGKQKYWWLLAWFLRPCLSRFPWFSACIGWLQKRSWTRAHIRAFIDKHHIDQSEFVRPVSAFTSFNDFFIRKLQPHVRPIAYGDDVAILPADGRYLVYPDIALVDGFWVKGQRFCLEKLLQDKDLAAQYAHGALVIARLCPSDYHRFHFPIHCVPSKTSAMSGSLYSVNPIALKRRIAILAENKRQLTHLSSLRFGNVLCIEVGATCVGTIHQTFCPGEHYVKGEEKGYFSFGGSTMLLFFLPGRILLDHDLVEASQERLEVRGLMGQSLGRALSEL